MYCFFYPSRAAPSWCSTFWMHPASLWRTLLPCSTEVSGPVGLFDAVPQVSGPWIEQAAAHLHGCQHPHGGRTCMIVSDLCHEPPAIVETCSLDAVSVMPATKDDLMTYHVQSRLHKASRPRRRLPIVPSTATVDSHQPTSWTFAGSASSSILSDLHIFQRGVQDYQVLLGKHVLSPCLFPTSKTTARSCPPRTSSTSPSQCMGSMAHC